MMRGALVLALVVLLSGRALGQTIGPGPAYCGKSFFLSAGATAMTQQVAAVAGQRVVVCGYVLNAGAAAASFQLSAGTGTNCNVSNVALTPTFSLPINGVIANRGVTVGETTAVGSALCYTITGTGPMNAVVYYDQY
jgi:hypothetical protein